ncbi:ABC transporter substrate-binding protein [Streptomyces mutabilis]|jgi:NitT/TauT family transport system substrate-binding protein|uniref:ABC transporter substrate-binding protein n=1 Tax=Streptomyces TaxID=1883 RepID=UPI000A221838|nr:MULTISPECIES: ABC transporter substrate-binding protein [unclassified Streptomyces]MDG9689478.1 ABC transporter substrate-binding protein [Streptomyces sp. DH17]OSC71615.1 nitrate ABC transporter substrate-binding protein [Streptomyces sp. 4F]MDN3246536.1 ABC transporter substrate-binding protein [Streptomyces sp. ZSW22]MDN3252839.1 ABC transporter substrate-binding protein [Streptomyces sp. MA25(2023)]MDQ0384189.1 NitT/TauT family transport system substrate-binding protein [Streptomyces sp
MRRLFVGLTAVSVLAAATACGSSDSGGPDDSGSSGGGTTTVKVGLIPIVDVAPLYLGQKKGFFEERGLKLEFSSAQGGAAIVPGVVSGQFQFGFSNMTSLMIARSNDVPVKAVANGIASTGVAGKDFEALTVKGDSPIKSPKELEGKKVAINTLKNINETAVRASVRKAGGDPDAVELVELAFDQMPAALDAGRVDAAMVVEPALATVKSQGGREIANPMIDIAPKLTVAMYFTSTRYAQENPETVKKFQEATAESLAYADAHPDEVREIVTTYTKIPADVLAKVTLPKWPAEPDRAGIEELAKLGREDGLFEKAPDLDELLP